MAKTKKTTGTVAETAKALNIAKINAINAQKSELLSQIDEKIKKYNDSAEFAEYKKMEKISNEIEELRLKYNMACESEHITRLAAEPDPMLALCKNPEFEILTIKEVKDEASGAKVRALTKSMHRLDPLKLHKSIPEGIGKNKSWPNYTERLNMVFTAAVAVSLDAVNSKREKLTVEKVTSTIKLSPLSEKVSLSTEDPEDLIGAVKEVVSSMIGDEYEVTAKMVEYLKNCHTKAGRASCSVVASQARSMRLYMVDICRIALGESDITLIYKEKK